MKKAIPLGIKSIVSASTRNPSREFSKLNINKFSGQADLLRAFEEQKQQTEVKKKEKQKREEEIEKMTTDTTQQEIINHLINNNLININLPHYLGETKIKCYGDELLQYQTFVLITLAGFQTFEGEYIRTDIFRNFDIETGNFNKLYRICLLVIIETMRRSHPLPTTLVEIINYLYELYNNINPQDSEGADQAEIASIQEEAIIATDEGTVDIDERDELAEYIYRIIPGLVEVDSIVEYVMLALSETGYMNAFNFIFYQWCGENVHDPNFIYNITHIISNIDIDISIDDLCDWCMTTNPNPYDIESSLLYAVFNKLYQEDVNI
jgi:hypothetical protein